MGTLAHKRSACNRNVISETVTVEDPNPSLHRCDAVRFGDLTLQNAGKYSSNDTGSHTSRLTPSI